MTSCACTPLYVGEGPITCCREGSKTVSPQSDHQKRPCTAQAAEGWWARLKVNIVFKTSEPNVLSDT